MEFQAIVLAGGKGSRMSDLTSDIPKCLLPIGNKPMIWYPVRMLEKAGFNEIFIITFESIKSRVETELKLIHGIRTNLIMVGIDDLKGDEGDDAGDDDEMGTAYSLRVIKDKIFKDCMVVSCDLMASLNIQAMANFFRINNASFVALLADVVEQSLELPVPGSKGKFSLERDIIALDSDTNRILYFNSQDDIEEIKVKYRVFQKFPKLIWTSKLQDAHFYIIKKNLIDFIAENKKINSIKSDFLPLICNKQFSVPHKKHSGREQNPRVTVFDYLKSENQSSSSSSHTKPINEELLSCYGFILADGFCYRANNLAIYAESNRQVLAKLMHYYQREKSDFAIKFQVGSDNLIDDGATFGEKCVIKRSVIGKNCKIGDKVKITNSVLMDNVTLEEGALIQGSILCSNSKIKAKCELKDCLVGFNQDILTTGKFSNETIVDIDSLIEE